MALAVERPARHDLPFRDNDDKLVGFQWHKSDGVTPVVITSAELAFEFDPPAPVYDPDTGEEIPWITETHVINSTTPGNTDGWIDTTRYAEGVVLVMVPHGIWATYATRCGRWDVAAVGEGIQGCLDRGRFNVEQGVSTP